MKKNNSIITIMGLFIVISLISVVNASFSAETLITGEAVLRVSADIRLTDLKVLNMEANAYEMYSSKYSKDSTSMFVSLPNIDSVIVYEVTVSNFSDKLYELDNIIIENKSNDNIKYEIIGIEKGDEFSGSSSKTFTIKLSYNTDVLTDNISEILSIKYDFVERTYPYVVMEYDYSGKTEEFVVPHNGIYKLEVWGAQGGTAVIGDLSNRGGYGGYSVGEIELNKSQKLYIAVGGEGEHHYDKVAPELPEEMINELALGGFNGGGNAAYAGRGAGGGATSIYTKLISDGQLSNYENNIDEILIVAGGGGGGQVYKEDNNIDYSGIGGSGGGYLGGEGIPLSDEVYGYGTGGSQSEGGTAVDIEISLEANSITDGSFGQGAFVKTGYKDFYVYSSGGGGGFYGGGALEHGPAGGGSGYINNSSLYNKYMVCYECSTSTDSDIMTNSMSSVSEIATADTPKIGNGYVKITLLRRIYK